MKKMKKMKKIMKTEKYICKDCGKGTYSTSVSSRSGDKKVCSHCHSENLELNPDHIQGTPYYKIVGANWNDL